MGTGDEWDWVGCIELGIRLCELVSTNGARRGMFGGVNGAGEMSWVGESV